MYPGLLFLPLLCGLILAGFTLVPGLVALGLAHATRNGTSGRLRSAVHVGPRRLGVLLVAISCGMVGGGLAGSVFLVTALVTALILDSNFPQAGALVDDGSFGFLYMGTLLLGFLGSFALGMARLNRWLTPRVA